MSRPAELRRFIQGVIKAEKARQNLTYDDLSERLAACGIRQTPTNLSTKIGRGDMSAKVFLALLKAMNLRSLSLDELKLGG